jgi:peptidoglycan L-alanyl-D-glutamate endopeptidase CwlK
MNKTSLKNLESCHPDLQRLAHAVDKEYAIQCICGHRGKEAQNRVYAKKLSRLQWPHSKHNRLPSLAGDFVPDPDKNPATINWTDIEAFIFMCQIFEIKAKELGIKIRLGRDFKFKDYPHIEVVLEKAI